MIVFAVLMAILVVVAFLVFTLVGNGIIKRADGDSYDVRRGQKIKRLRFIVCIPLIAILIGSCMISGFRVIDSTEIGVVRTLGRIDHTIGDGPHLVNPLFDTVEKYDLRVHVRESSFGTYTKDAQPVSAAVEYQYAIQPGRVMGIARDYGSQEILESKLSNVVEEKAKIVFARYSAMPLLEARSGLSAEVEAEMTELEDRYGVEFSSVIIRDIDFSDAFEASVEAKMTAEQQALTAEQQKKAALVKAQEKAEVAKINAEAEVAKAEGEAKALQITRDALKNMPDAWIAQQYLEKWDGQLPKIVGESDLMLAPGMIGQ